MKYLGKIEDIKKMELDKSKLYLIRNEGDGTNEYMAWFDIENAYWGEDCGGFCGGFKALGGMYFDLRDGVKGFDIFNISSNNTENDFYSDDDLFQLNDSETLLLIAENL